MPDSVGKMVNLQLVAKHINFLMQYKSRFLNWLTVITSCVCFYWFCDIILHFPPLEPVWQVFGDCEDYLDQSEMALWSIDFFIPSPHPGFYPRPFTIPLFYKLAGSDPESIVWMQKIVYCMAIGVFVNSFLILIKNKLIRIAVLPFLYYFFTWWVIVGFTENLLSESLSMSFLFLWIAGLILCIYFKNRYTLVLVLFISTLFSFTRDTWPYIILLANALLLAVYYRKDVRLKRNLLVLNAYGVLIFLFQSHTATVGERYRMPLYNVLSTRVSKNPEYVAWFKERGLPMADSLTLNLSHIDPDNRKAISEMYDSYNDSSYQPVRDWIMKKGKNTYIVFMLTHLSYFFLQDQSPEQKARIFSTANHDYYLKAKGYYEEVDKVFPFFSLPFLLYTSLILTGLGLVAKPVQISSFFPGFLIVLFFAHVFLSYNTDTFEVKRHLFITQVMIQLTSILALTLLIDRIFVVLTNLKAVDFILKKRQTNHS
jgi:hypothetical protein